MLTELVAPGLAVRRTLVLVAKELVTISVPVFNARRIDVVVVVGAANTASAVAKDVPWPVALLSTRAQGITPLFVVPVTPVCPMKAKPAPVEAIVATPAAAALPRPVPRNKTVPPVEASESAPKIKLDCRVGSGVTVTTELPRCSVKVPKVSPSLATDPPE